MMYLKRVSFELATKLKEIDFTHYENTDLNSKLKPIDITVYSKTRSLHKGEDMVFSMPKYNDDDYILAPSLELVKMWFKKIYNIHIHITYSGDKDEDFDYNYEILYFIGNHKKRYKNAKYVRDNDYVGESTYEEALEVGLLKACKIIKEKNIKK